MELGVILLICTLILCVTGVLDTPLSTLGMRPYTCAFLCGAFIILHGFTIPVFQELSIHPAAAVLMLLSAVAAIRAPQKAFFLASLLALMTAGAALALRLYLPVSFEPGLWMGLLCAGAAVLLRHAPLSAIYAAALAPLLFACLFMGYEYMMYGYSILDLGIAEHFDAQIVGILCAATVAFLHERRRARA